MKKNKKQFIISIIAIVILMLFVLGATYAYFQAQTGEGASTNINITSSTVDSLTFSTGDAISLSATQSNFGTGSASLSGSTTASATLVANNSTNYAEATYYLYVKISSNDFTYTTSDSTPELILSITGPDGDVTSLSGLNYTTVEDNQGVSYSGFDITTESGLIPVAELYEIVSSGTETDEWTITVTFINLSTDQSVNAGSSFSAEVIIQQEEINFSSYIISLASVENNLYYHASDVLEDTTGTTYEVDYYCSYDGNEVYGVSSSIREEECSSVYNYGSYYYTEDYIDYTFYNGTSSVSWDSTNSICTVDGLSSGSYSLSGPNGTPTESECTGVAYQYADTTYYYLGFEYVGSGEWINLATLGAQDNSYRYSGASDEVDNYVCFGSDEDICPDDNLYRIIGLSLNDDGEYEMKLIKADYASSSLLGTDGDYYGNNLYYWNKVNYSTAYNATKWYNVWSYSQLNTVNLNTNYWNTLESKWQDMITTHKWIVGGSYSQNISDVAIYSAFQSELNQVDDTYDAKIGLMYVSDYGYAASPTYWDTILSSYSNVAYYNWLYKGTAQWTITRSLDFTHTVYFIESDGDLNPYGAVQVYVYDIVRPTFYLSSSVVITSGSGTYESPYRISL